MEELNEIELHDALLEKVDINYLAKTVTAHVVFYVDSQASARQHATIVFHCVESISTICNLQELEKNLFAGHISYWVPAGAGKPTYIYLAAGCVAIVAERIEFLVCDSEKGTGSN